MANIKILEEASVTANLEGTPFNMNGSIKTISIQADSYGTNGKIILKASPNVDGAVFQTLEDGSGLAEYSANKQVVLDKLPAGWQIRADITISSGTMTNALVVMGG